MATFIIGAIVFGILALISINLYKNRKKGTTCGCGCEGCPSANRCK
ncbi:MAG: FeoB-associated Cys-rich membrane protein [Clostridiaceae bacterium]|nr:FeoB-associated Cys-rich membrane protein [Clostridiaceae bacterium]